MLSKRAILSALAVLVPASIVQAKIQSSVFPSVEELQKQLNMFPGRSFPKLIVFEGRAYQAFYEGARYLGNGAYEGRIRVHDITS